MPSYNTLQNQVNTKVVYWVEISGLPYIFTDGNITQANIATLFGDAYIPTLTVIPNLIKPKITNGMSIELLSGKGNSSGLDLDFLDLDYFGHTDGIMTWLFGGDDDQIKETRLTANIGKDPDGENWAVASTAGFDTNGILYCELETIQHYGKTATSFQSVDRALYYSSAGSHTKKEEYDLYPRISTKPTLWEGRIVTLCQTYMDANGQLAQHDSYGNVTCRAMAMPIKGILKNKSYSGSEQCWHISCVGIDNLLKRKAFRKIPELEVTIGSQFIEHSDRWNSYIQDKQSAGLWDPAHWHCSSTAVQAVVVQLQAAGNGVPYHWIVEIEEGRYSSSEFIEYINTQFGRMAHTDSGDREFFPGSLTVSINGSKKENGISFKYTQPTQEVAGGTIYSCAISFGINNMRENGSSLYPYIYWRRAGFDIGMTRDYINIADVLGIDAGNYGLYYGTTSTLNIEYITDQTLTILTDQTTNVVLSDGDLYSLSDFSVNDYVTFGSGNTKQLARILAIDLNNNKIKVKGITFRAVNLDLAETVAHPVKMKKCCLLYDGMIKTGLGRTYAHPLAHPVLSLLMSTGESGYNHSKYDRLELGQGIEIPCKTQTGGRNIQGRLIDYVAFEKFFDSIDPYIISIIDIIDEPLDVYEWLTKRLAFFGAYLVIKKGMISVSQGYFALKREDFQSEAILHSISPSELIGNHNIDTGGFHKVDQIRWKYNFSHYKDEFNKTYQAGYGDPETDMRELNIVELEDKGIYTSKTLLDSLAMKIMSEFEKETWAYDLEVDRSKFDLEAGDIIELNDQAGEMPNVSGSRGHSGTRMLLTNIQNDHGSQTAKLTLLHSRVMRGGFAPPVHAISFTKSASESTITIAPNQFAQSDGLFLSSEDYTDRMTDYWSGAEIQDIFEGNPKGLTVADYYADDYEENRFGRDIDHFAVGDTVRVDVLNPNHTGTTLRLTGSLITAINGNTITINQAMPAAVVSAVTPIILHLDNIVRQDSGNIAVQQFTQFTTGSLIAGLDRRLPFRL